MNFSDLLPTILPHVPGCPDPLVIDTVRRAAIIFCRDSHAWSEQLNGIYPVEGVLRYRLDPPEDTQIVAIDRIGYRSRSGFSELPEHDWPKINAFGLLTFDRQPHIGKGPIEVHVILAPSETAASILDQFGSKYREGLIHGATGILQSMPNKDWSNPPLASYHNMEFESSKREARNRRANGDSERPMRVAPRHLL
ncbi:hypothetical protein A3765_28505 [Oleiphilus sp. HI0130]|nr:hypothetical protein A3765_28780 [Oleiphilus sp. HI0130]KZZ72494.1 hypothetical protein A3765_28505 [Oleiphilus sp. HI0130]